MSERTDRQASAEQRLDKWLWAARFFKTRAQAATAIRGGKVRHNGLRPKPARLVKAGDRLLISRGDENFELTVLALSGRRLSAPLAAELFEEDAVSRERRENLREGKRVERLASPDFGKRPDKRSRRQIRRLTGKHPEP